MSLDKLMEQNLGFLETIRKQNPVDAFDMKDVAFADEERQRRIKAGEANIEGLSKRRDEVLRSFDEALAAEKSELERLYRMAPETSDKANTALHAAVVAVKLKKQK